MKFIDLFAWLGWFHNALTQLWHECVFASELDPKLCELYNKNYNFPISWDITKINEKDIPKHDILSAWFPCQSFSHAGKQNWLTCGKNGNLFFEISRILRYHKPKYFILENVANLLHHDKWNTWNIIYNELTSLGYFVDKKILSPHEFWIPHHRKRIFIVWSLSWLDKFEWPKVENTTTNIVDIIDKEPMATFEITKRDMEVLNMWQKILKSIPIGDKFPSFPIWSMEFWADYPIEEMNPNSMSEIELWKYKWAFGVSLSWLWKEEQMNLLPSYVTFAKHKDKFPAWKIRFINENRDFYKKYKKILDKFIPEIMKYPSSFQKFEWNCQWSERDIFQHIIQFRASGVRVKKANTSPSLISSTSSQIPIIWWEKRYMTPKEASRLQGMDNIEMPWNIHSAFKALWNWLNATIVMKIAKNLLK